MLGKALTIMASWANDNDVKDEVAVAVNDFKRKNVEPFDPSNRWVNIENTREEVSENDEVSEDITAELKRLSLKHNEEMTLPQLQPKEEINLSSIGKSLQDGLIRFGIVSKKNMDAKIEIEDYRSRREDGLAFFYFSYDKKITPSEFIRMSKTNGNLEADLYGIIICDALKISFIKDGIGMVAIQLSRGA